MFIRTTPTRNSTTGETYITHRLVESRRVGGKVRQVTLLNLGRQFAVPRERWPEVCQRIEHLLSGQQTLAPVAVIESVERAAQHCVARLIAEGMSTPTPSSAPPTPVIHAEVDPDSLELTQPRSIGVEHVALAALRELEFEPLLAQLGISGVMRTAIIGSVIARMAAPGSELSSHRWLTASSGLGDLLEVDLAALPLSRLYRASDVLLRHREAIETALFARIETLFSLEASVTLYDLTNTYFEGDVESNPQAKHARSKEKRSDCPLVTLGMVLDGSGFVRRSRTFEGNVSEGATLDEMLTGLNAPSGALVIMDAGIATEANIAWLVEQEYRYLVVRRGGTRQFDNDQSVAIETASGETVRLQKESSEDGNEVLLYCHSSGREAKETAMFKQFSERYVAGLQHIADGLQKPRAEKRYEKLLIRIGRLKQKSMGAGQHYTLNFTTDESGKIVTGLTWEKATVNGTMATHPGVYCLRSNELSWDEEKLWRTYTMLTDLESVFRSLKSELGMRPVFHSKEDRADGHLFITVLAYQLVQVLRKKLKAAHIHDSWSSLRNTLEVQRRVTASFKLRDGRTLNVRKTALAEPDLMKIYKALKCDSAPGGVRKMIS